VHNQITFGKLDQERHRNCKQPRTPRRAILISLRRSTPTPLNRPAYRPVPTPGGNEETRPAATIAKHAILRCRGLVKRRAI